MSTTKYTLTRDLEEAKALADNLLPYVYGEELYGSIGGKFGSSSMPSLTIGALLLRLRRLHALESNLTEPQKALLASIDAQNENVHSEWTQHYNNKLVAEANSRLKVIERYFDECTDDPRTCANNYLPEALRRTIVEDILAALERYNASTSELERAAKSIDSGLRRFVQPAEFIWAKELQPAYPQDVYWWLYTLPPKVAK